MLVILEDRPQRRAPPDRFAGKMTPQDQAVEGRGQEGKGNRDMRMRSDKGITGSERREALSGRPAGEAARRRP
jgi:hypothetical protein